MYHITSALSWSVICGYPFFAAMPAQRIYESFLTWCHGFCGYYCPSVHWKMQSTGRNIHGWKADTKAPSEHPLTQIWLWKYLRLSQAHASLLISKLGAQPNLVAARLGHEKIQTTLATYSHLYPNQSRDLADQLDGLMEGLEVGKGGEDAGKA